jgi:hypothetical protein
LNIVRVYRQRGGNAAAVRAFDARIAKLRREGKLQAAVLPYKITGG